MDHPYLQAMPNQPTELPASVRLTPAAAEMFA